VRLLTRAFVLPAVSLGRTRKAGLQRTLLRLRLLYRRRILRCAASLSAKHSPVNYSVGPETAWLDAIVRPTPGACAAVCGVPLAFQNRSMSREQLIRHVERMLLSNSHGASCYNPERQGTGGQEARGDTFGNWFRVHYATVPNTKFSQTDIRTVQGAFDCRHTIHVFRALDRPKH